MIAGSGKLGEERREGGKNLGLSVGMWTPLPALVRGLAA